jgi:chitinase
MMPQISYRFCESCVNTHLVSIWFFLHQRVYSLLSDGSPLSDVSGFAKVLDYIEIMNYDIWWPWSPTVGPNAPLNDTCAATQNQAGSTVSAVQKWHAAGFPLGQIVLGLASYGHSFSVNGTDAFERASGSTSLLAPYPKFNASAHPKGDSWDDGKGVDECRNAQFPGGTIEFRGLIQLGYLNSNGTLKQGIFFRYDNCSQTVSFFFSVLLSQVLTGSDLAICV